MFKLVPAFALALALVPAATLAQADSGAAPPRSVLSRGDPDEVICWRQREIGTRIAIRRDCMSRRDWVEYRRLTRADVDRAQLTRTIPMH